MIQLAWLFSYASLSCCCVLKCWLHWSGGIIVRVKCCRPCVQTPTLWFCGCVQCPALFAVFVWCYFSRKRKTPLSSGSAVLLCAIHACCGVHRVKHNKGRPLFTSGTNHPDGTSINPPPCRRWLECTYVWPWTIQMCQRQIEWGCTEAIFSLARWPVACSRLLSHPHLLLTMCQQLGKCLSFTC